MSSRIQTDAVCQPEAHQCAEMRIRRCFLVDVKELRIEAAGKGLDLVGIEDVPSGHHHIAEAEIVEIFHDAAPGSRRPGSGCSCSDKSVSASSIISN